MPIIRAAIAVIIWRLWFRGYVAEAGISNELQYISVVIIAAAAMIGGEWLWRY